MRRAFDADEKAAGKRASKRTKATAPILPLSRSHVLGLSTAALQQKSASAIESEMGG